MKQRYFLEVCYRGDAYAGFQVQANARTVQGEVERALQVLLRHPVELTGSSRTDAGVHARQNYFHFDFEGEFSESWLYNINSILADDIAARKVVRVKDDAHCRFDAVYREYVYTVYGTKDPFIRDTAYYFPFRIDTQRMQAAAAVVGEYVNFESFAKRNTQVKTFECQILESRWEECDGYWRYRVRANRFLRGMVRGLVGTMLQVGRGKLDMDTFREVIAGRDLSRADFSVPGRGLCLEEVGFREGYF